MSGINLNQLFADLSADQTRAAPTRRPPQTRRAPPQVARTTPQRQPAQAVPQQPQSAPPPTTDPPEQVVAQSLPLEELLPAPTTESPPTPSAGANDALGTPEQVAETPVSRAGLLWEVRLSLYGIGEPEANRRQDAQARIDSWKRKFGVESRQKLRFPQDVDAIQELLAVALQFKFRGTDCVLDQVARTLVQFVVPFQRPITHDQFKDSWDVLEDLCLEHVPETSPDYAEDVFARPLRWEDTALTDGLRHRHLCRWQNRREVRWSLIADIDFVDSRGTMDFLGPAFDVSGWNGLFDKLLFKPPLQPENHSMQCHGWTTVDFPERISAVKASCQFLRRSSSWQLSEVTLTFDLKHNGETTQYRIDNKTTHVQDGRMEAHTIDYIDNEVSFLVISTKSDDIALYFLVCKRRSAFPSSEEARVLHITTAPQAPPRFIEYELPNCFQCPIGLQVMEDPAISVPAGFTYEKENLQEWAAQSAVDPQTRIELQPGLLMIDNRALRDARDEYISLSAKYKGMTQANKEIKQSCNEKDAIILKLQTMLSKHVPQADIDKLLAADG